MNRFSGIHNSLSRIMSAQHVNRTSALLRYIDWQRRRLLGLFPIDETISRSQIRVTDSRSGVGALVHTQRMYDYNNMRFLQDVLRWKEGVFFDIGANIGVYAVIASEVAEARSGRSNRIQGHSRNCKGTSRATAGETWRPVGSLCGIETDLS